MKFIFLIFYSLYSSFPRYLLSFPRRRESRFAYSRTVVSSHLAKSKRILIPTIFLFLLTLVFCQPIFAAGIDSEQLSYLTHSDEKKLAKQFLAMLKQQEVILNDPVVNAYVEAIGQRLGAKAHMQQKLHFFVVANDSINAFSGPDGYIGVNTGLFRVTQNESELASVLAHEIGHVKQQHLARMLAQAKANNIPAILGALGAIALGVVNPLAGIGAFTAVTAGYMQSLINYTRSHEKEADRVGMDILYQSGYNPFEMPRMFDKLAKAEVYFPDEVPTYLRTHPVNSERIADSENRALEYPKKIYGYQPLSFLLIKRQISVDVSIDASRNVADFRANEHLKKNEYVRMADRYGEAIAYLKLQRAKDAVPILKALIKEDPDEVLFYYALAECYTQQKEFQKAQALYKISYQAHPHYYPLVLAYASNLIDTKKSNEARAFLLDHFHEFRSKPEIYYLLAKAEARSGFYAQSQITQAQLYELLEEPESAVMHLEIALRDRTISADDRFRAASLLKKIQVGG